MDETPFIQNGRTYLPARFVAEAFGYEVGWCGDTRTVTVGPPGQVEHSSCGTTVSDPEGIVVYPEDWGILENTTEPIPWEQVLEMSGL
jgi:hypothetical protein